jgi:hypothetical protein
VPAGFDADGMPTAVQLVARPDDEATLFALAAQLEQARPWAQAPSRGGLTASRKVRIALPEGGFACRTLTRSW